MLIVCSSVVCLDETSHVDLLGIQITSDKAAVSQQVFTAVMMFTVMSIIMSLFTSLPSRTVTTLTCVVFCQ